MKVRIQYKTRLEKSRKRHLSYAHDRMEFKATSELSRQLEDAVNYCKANKCKGYAALATGQFPMIKDARTINRGLNPEKPSHIAIGEEKAYCKILSEDQRNG